MIRSFNSTAFLIGILTLLPVAALSCGFHTLSARKSVVESLINGETVVLATADPSNPFRYTSSEAIRGELTSAEIPFLVDSTTRKKLARNSDDRVLFARNTETGEWERLAYIDKSNGQIFHHILASFEAWPNQSVDRYQFFGSLLGHNDPAIRNLALIEIDQAPYNVLQTLNTNSVSATLMSSFTNPRELYLKPIKILTLGFSDTEAVGQFLYKGFERSLDYPQDRLIGAYATAIIERDGSEGLEKLSTAITSGPPLSAESQDAIFQAMMIHYMHGPRHLRERVGRTMRELVVKYPGITENVRNTIATRPGTSVISRRRGIRF